MEKYRLKKWYPSLGKKTKKGHVFGKKIVIEDFKKKYVNQTVPELKYLDVDEVENNPEFWEEIIEQNYEILSFYFHGKIYEKTGEMVNHYLTGKPYNVFRAKGQTGMITNERVESRSFDENHYIFSVKRLSDRKVFTIGDRVSATNNFYTGGMFYKGKVSERVSENWSGEFYDTAIKNFEFAGGRLCIMYDTERTPIGQPIEYVSKLRDKKPKNNYEILEISATSSNLSKPSILNKKVNGLFAHSSYYKGVFKEEDLLTNDINLLIQKYPDKFDEDDKHIRYQIHKIKRLSDGEVFTIGDKIEGYKNTGIKEITFFQNELRIITDANGDGCVTDKLSWHLESCKKIIEPSYEILSLIFNEDGKLCYKDTDGCFKYERQLGQNGFNDNLNACLNNGWSINSIKRLSDGQILTLGDKIEVRGLRQPTIIEKITFIEGDDEIEINNFIYLFDIQKVDRCIFKAKYDVNIYEGNKLYWAKKGCFTYELKTKDGLSITNKNQKLYGVLHHKDYKDNPNYLEIRHKEFEYFMCYGLQYWEIFSSKKLAEDFVNKNKPLLTTEDGVKIFYGDRVYWQNPHTSSIVSMKLYSKNDISGTRKYFSTPEKTKQHIINNIKVLEV